MNRTPLLRPMLLPGLPRVWRGPYTLQLGLDPARAVLIDLPDPRTARVLDLLDGSRSERGVLARAAAEGLPAEDTQTLLETLHEAGFVMSAASLLPPTLPEAARRRLSAEATAIALRLKPPIPAQRPGWLPPPAQPSPSESAAGPPGPGPQAPGAQAPGPQAAGPQAAGPQAPGPQAPGPQASNPPATRQPATGQTATGQAAAGHPETSQAAAGPPATGQATTAQPTTSQAATGPPTTGQRGGSRSGASARRGASAPISPAQILRRRGGARVVIAGRGRLGAPIAVALAEAGVGHVHADVAGVVTASELPGGPLRAEDIGRPRAEAVAEAVRRATPEAETHSVRRGAASLVVQLGYEQPVALLAAGHAARRQPHLAVTIREGSVVIGPLVPAAGSPCLNCLDLHRQDRDEGWPTAGIRLDHAAAEPCTVAVLLAATGYVVGEVLTFVDGGSPQTLGAGIEIAEPGKFRRRTWPPHPNCGCSDRRPRRGGP